MSEEGHSRPGNSADADPSVELRRFRQYYLESALWNLQIVSRTYGERAETISGQTQTGQDRLASLSRAFYQVSSNAREDSGEASAEPGTSSGGGAQGLLLEPNNSNTNRSTRPAEAEYNTYDTEDQEYSLVQSPEGPHETMDQLEEMRQFRRYYLEAALWNLEIVSMTYREGAGTFRLQPPIEPARYSTLSRSLHQDSSNAREDSEESSVVPQTTSSGDSQSSPLEPNNSNTNRSSSEGEDEDEDEYEDEDEDEGEGEVATQEPHEHVHPSEGPYVVDTMAAGNPSSFSEVNITMWRDGFTVDNGVLRSYTESRERERQGHVLAEIYPRTQIGVIFVSLADHRLENYITSSTDFPGIGRTLGSTATEPTEEMYYQEGESIHPSVARSVRVDESLPTTTVQVRLPQGERIQVVLNHVHTVGDLRAKIMEQRPDLLHVSFALSTAFPCRQLENDDITLRDHNILNSSLFLRYI